MHSKIATISKVYILQEISIPFKWNSDFRITLSMIREWSSQFLISYHFLPL